MIGWAVCSVPTRRERAEALAETVGGVVVAHDPPQPSHRLLNLANAWEAAIAQGKEWSCVLEDDLFLCQDFPFRMEMRVKEARRLGQFALTFYSSRKLEDRDKEKRWRKRSLSVFMSSQCLCFHSNLARSLVVYIRQTFDPENPWIDMKIKDFLKVTGTPIYECLPNLVDHDLSLGSTLGHPKTSKGVPCTSKSFHVRGR